MEQMHTTNLECPCTQYLPAKDLFTLLNQDRIRRQKQLAWSRVHIIQLERKQWYHVMCYDTLYLGRCTELLERKNVKKVIIYYAFSICLRVLQCQWSTVPLEDDNYVNVFELVDFVFGCIMAGWSFITDIVNYNDSVSGW